MFMSGSPLPAHSPPPPKKCSGNTRAPPLPHLYSTTASTSKRYINFIAVMYHSNNSLVVSTTTYLTKKPACQISPNLNHLNNSIPAYQSLTWRMLTIPPKIISAIAYMLWRDTRQQDSLLNNLPLPFNTSTYGTPSANMWP